MMLLLSSRHLTLLPSRPSFKHLQPFFIMSATKNASGLAPSESKSLEERNPEPREQKVLMAIKEMYSCNPNNTTFDVYSEDAVFHDPVGIATGPKSIRAQFVGLAKLFEKADIPKFRVLKNPPQVPQGTILVDQDVAYYRDAFSSPTKTMNSLLTLELDNEGKLRRHIEEWDHEKSSTSQDGFLGMINEHRKKFSASATEAIFGK
ncbi:hypothetical protein DEU56DRAFT_767689 [Suillus clintonianus]|uniref:uncharacterized protein n=1 Tax=Suillus clintonianus TaxID=1904413 RepID=UPI001B87D661|nr:uncharacterized protein DEU56DRAFT_767689 [Suillus clintonianus]KAG2155492.1 hypothetical protein DEU56DRAFT_767689 [Suillus clintonianus]